MSLESESMSPSDAIPATVRDDLATVQRSRLWILGLNHSGTTIVWRSFRKDHRFLCFDEPLTGDIATWFPRNNAKRTYDEYLRLFGSTPNLFWDLYQPIQPLQELETSFSKEQERYLRFLLQQSPHVVIDETHVHRHLSSIAAITPDAHVVHLYRRASAFATSHLRPSWSESTTQLRRAVRRVRSKYNERVLWVRQDFPPGMRRDEVIGSHPTSKFGLILAEANYDSERIMAAPAVVRLLAYWHYHYHYLEHEGPALYGNRFFSLPYEEFAHDSKGVMGKLYDWIGLLMPEGVDYSDVHAPKPAYRAGSRRWREAAKIAGFSDEEIETLL